jgi:hypothetical protein
MRGWLGGDFKGRKGCRAGKVRPLYHISESEASDPSAAPSRWGGASVPEKAPTRQAPRFRYA